MATTKTPKSAPSIFTELSDLFASSPTPEEIIKFHPSLALQRRARALLAKRKEGRRLTDAEASQMEEFLQAEFFMGLLKAKLHARKASRS